MISKLNREVSRVLNKTERYRSDPITPMCMLILGIIGVFFIYSAQSYSGGTQWKSQIVWLLAGAGLYMLTSLIDYKLYLRNAHWIYGVCILLLLALWTPLGKQAFGALRWLDLKVFHIQPSDTAKIGTAILIASVLARSEIKTVRESYAILFKTAAVFSLPILLIFLQPDLGSSLVFPPMVFSMLYVSNLSERFFITFFAIFLIGVAVVGLDIHGYNKFLKENNLSPIRDQGAYEKHSWVPLKDYQRNRILSFAAPEVIDPRGIGISWNLRQSLISVGSGGLVGKGHNKSTQSKLGYLPQSVASNDFIFSVFAEEKGFIGGLFVIGLYSLLVLNGIRIAGLARDRFGLYLAVGISAIFMVHIFVNIGMTIGLMPITGLPLPFLSYGGSFVLSCCILQGLIQSVYRFRKDFA